MTLRQLSPHNFEWGLVNRAMTTALLTALSDAPGNVCPTDEQQRVCFAVTSKDVDALRALIDAGADVQTPFDCCDDDKAPRRFNPLQWAAYYDVVAVVRLLIDHGRVPVDSCSRDEPSTPLVLGAAVGSCDSSRFLVERGASLASTNPSGRCLVEIAHFNLADVMLAAIAADPSMLTRAISDTFVKGLLRSERAEATVLLDRVIGPRAAAGCRRHCIRGSHRHCCSAFAPRFRADG
jgi:hypothetical protein